jgi:2-polyprenyl-6-methoxyphenol hydroxylase-like FAD-dependent oxidoreductase
MNYYDCVVAGGGPAGMIAGLLLARAGVRVVVREKHEDFLQDVCRIALGAGNRAADRPDRHGGSGVGHRSARWARTAGRHPAGRATCFWVEPGRRWQARTPNGLLVPKEIKPAIEVEPVRPT